MRFRDREDAGVRLGKKLEARRFDKPIVIGLPRGGVPVAAEVASALHAPLDVWVVRKLGVPLQPELALARSRAAGLCPESRHRRYAAAERTHRAARDAGTPRDRAASRRIRSRAPFDARGRTVIPVDDGIATGATMLAAIESTQQLEPARIVIAVGVALATTA
jgi:putative phosphoribosyl transferase